MKPNQCVCGEYGEITVYTGKTAQLTCPKCGVVWSWVNPDIPKSTPKVIK